MSASTSRRVRFTGATTHGRTGETLVLELPGDPMEPPATDTRADVRLWLPSKADLPDAFTLLGEAAGTGQEVYRLTRTVKDHATALAEGALYSLEFSYEEGLLDSAFEDPALMALSGSDVVAFRLLHYPGGIDAGGAREVFHDLWHGGVFRYGPGQTPVGSDQKQAAGFVATRFYHGDTLAFPDDDDGLRLRGEASLCSEPEALDAPTTAAPRPVVYRGRVWPLGLASGGIDPSEATAAAQNQGVPEDEAVTASGDATDPPAGNEPSGRSSAPEAPHPLPPELDGVPTWLTLAGTPEATPEVLTDVTAEARLLGVWEVQETGRYRYAVYPEGAPAGPPTRVENDPRLPAPAGDPAPYVLVPTREVGERKGRAVTALTLPHPLPLAAAEAFALTSGGDDLSRISFATAADGISLERAEGSARYDASHWKVYLPDPVRVSLRLAERAETLLDLLAAWQEASAPATTNAALLATAAYDTAHRRTYLTERLPGEESIKYIYRRDGLAGGLEPSLVRDPTVDAVRLWRGFDAQATGLLRGLPNGHGESDLWHAVYGYRMQEAFLKHACQILGRRLEVWLHRGLVAGYLEAAAIGKAQADSEGAAADAASASGEAIAEAIGRMAACGAGAALTQGLWRDVLAAFAGLEIEEFEAVTTELEALHSASWDSFLGQSPFKTIWKVLRKGTKAAAVFLDSLPGPLAVAAGQAGAEVHLTGAQAKAVAGMLEWKLSQTHDGKYVVISRASGYVEYGFGPNGKLVGVARSNIVKIERNSKGGRRVHGPRFELRYTETSLSRSWNETATRLSGIGSFLNVVNVAVNGASVWRGARSGSFDIGDGITLGKTVAGIGSIVNDFGPENSLRMAKALRKASPYFEAAGASWSAVQALDDTDPFGAQDVPEIDGWQLTSAVLSGVGGAMLAFAGGAATVAGMPVVVVGFVVLGVGAVVAWIGDAREKTQRKLADPLYHWLPVSSVWGKASAVSDRRRLLTLALPGWAPEASSGEGGPTAEDLAGQSVAFAEKAFVFPVSVEPREERGRNGETVVTGLTVRIDPYFVPLAGTLRLNVTVGPTGVSETTVPVTIQRVVHYVHASNGFRYKILREGEPLAPEADLASQATREGWPRSVATEVEVVRPSGARFDEGEVVTETHEVLPVRLAPSSAVWPLRTNTEAEQLFAPLAERRLEELINSDAGAFAEQRIPGSLETLREQERQQEAIRLDTERGVDAGSVVIEPGLASVLGSARFRVSGFCVFDPAAPLDPDAEVPNAAPTDARKTEYVGDERSGLAYPDDF